MKIAVASDNAEMESLVCQIAGRAPYYLVFKNHKLIKTIKNPFTVGGGGAGLSVAQMLSNEDVDLVISGKFGEKMIGVLNEKGIKYKVLQDKTVKEAVDEVTK